MKKKVVFISLKAGDGKNEWPEILKGEEKYEIQFLPLGADVVGRLAHSHADVIVFDCPLFDQTELKIFIYVSRKHPNAHLIVLADQISIHCYREIGTLTNTVTLQKPLQAPMLKALLDRVASGENVKPAASPRFIIDENVRVLAMKSGLLMSTRMRNYSASGAFLEYHGISLNVGDEIKFTLSREGSKEAALDLQAKVVWVRNGEHSRSAIRGIGIQFQTA